MFTRSRTLTLIAAPVFALGCQDAVQAPPATQDDAAAAAALLLMVDEAVREAQASQATTDLEEPDALHVPPPEAVADRMLEVAEVKPSDVVYDLGCGNASVVVRAAERYGVKGLAFDSDPERVAKARDNVQAAGVEDLVSVEQADIFSLDLSPASVVALCLDPELGARLLPQLEALAPGSRVVSHDFGIEGVPEAEHLTLELDEEAEPHEIFLWYAPLDTRAPDEDSSDEAARSSDDESSEEGASDGASDDEASKGDGGVGDAVEPDARDGAVAPSELRAIE